LDAMLILRPGKILSLASSAPEAPVFSLALLH
jgi:hypothetical protein